MGTEVEVYDKAGVDFGDLSIWEKRAIEWPSAILEMEKHHALARENILAGYEKGSIEHRACEIVVNLSEPMVMIFAAQMSDPEMIPGSWVEKDPVATRKLLDSINLMRMSNRCGEYDEHLRLIAELAEARKSSDFKRMAKKLQDCAFADYDANRPVLMMSVHSYNRDELKNDHGHKVLQAEPDLRLYFKTADQQLLKLADRQNEALNKLHPKYKHPKLKPMLVDFVMGSGWQVASVTTGESMNKQRYVVAMNLFKYQRDVERVCELSGSDYDSEVLRNMTALIYTAHEGGHEYFNDSKLPEIYMEIATDLPDVVCNLGLDGVDKEYMVRAMLGNYVREVRNVRGELGDYNWGYAMASNVIVQAMVDTGLVENDRNVIGVDMSNLNKFLKRIRKTHTALHAKDKKVLTELTVAQVSDEVLKLKEMVCV